MNFIHTETRRMLADSLDRYIAERYPIEARHLISRTEPGYSPEQWAKFADLGVIAALFPEEHGGFGGAGFDIMVVFEALGRGLVVEPFLASAILAGSVLASVGRIRRRRGSMVPSSSIRLVAGTCTAALPERMLTRSRAFGSSSQSSASVSEVGVLRLFSAMVRSWVSAPEPGWV